MANKTILGCVNRTTGAITFEGEACNSGDYTGCIERTGEHAGQVKVIISEFNCDDTYYGCVNRTTGEFQLIIPDDCCICPCEENNFCPECFAANQTPIYVEITFSGVIDCDSGGLSELNGTWCLWQDEAEDCPGSYDCNWINDDLGIEQVDRICLGYDANPPSKVEAFILGDGYWRGYDEESGCGTSFPADITECDIGWGGKDGTATVANPC